MLDVPKRYRGWSLRDYLPRLQGALAPFFACDVWSVYLHGIVGSRKSSVAAAIIRHIRERGAWGSCDTSYGEWVMPERLRAAMLDFEAGKYMVEAWRTARLLVLDDLGSLRSTPHAQEVQLQLISSRYDNEQPTIATSNLCLDDLAGQIDGRAASRFQEGVVLDLGTTDWRKQGASHD